MRMTLRKLAIVVACIAAAAALIAVFGGGVQTFENKYEGVDLTADVTGLGRSNTYDGYLQSHASAPLGAGVVCADITAFEGEGEIRTAGDGSPCVYTPDGSCVTWKMQVEKAGMYHVMLDYLTVQSRGVDMERALYINGELPFDGAGDLTFSRLWTDAGEVRKDNQGNDVRPTQAEIYDWQQVLCQDSMGYAAEPYRFYFSEGENTLSLCATNEPMLLRGIRLIPVVETPNYAAYAASQPEAAMTETAKAWQATTLTST